MVIEVNAHGILEVLQRHQSGELGPEDTIIALRKITNASYWQMMHTYDPNYQAPEELRPFVKMYVTGEFETVGAFADAAGIATSSAGVILDRLGLRRRGLDATQISTHTKPNTKTCAPSFPLYRHTVPGRKGRMAVSSTALVSMERDVEPHIVLDISQKALYVEEAEEFAMSLTEAVGILQRFLGTAKVDLEELSTLS